MERGRLLRRDQLRPLGQAVANGNRSVPLDTAHCLSRFSI